MFQHNDYEILYLIKEGNDEALGLMFEKYSPLIYKKVYKFNLQYDIDDMIQEGLMVLDKSIRLYDEKYAKTFTRYFETNLERKFISIVSQRVRRNEIFKKNELFIYESNHAVHHNSVYYELYLKEIKKILTKCEFLVYTLRELKNYSISYISENYDLHEKKIYNSLHRAKTKIISHFKN